MMTEKEQASEPSVQPTNQASEGESKEKPPEQKESKIEALQQKFDEAEGKVLDKQREELEALEKRVDKKIASYKKMVDENEQAGRSKVSSPETKEDKITREANKFLENAGMDPI